MICFRKILIEILKKEMEFEAIQPTRTYREEERSLRVGGSETVLVEQIPYTVYNVEKITARVTNSPTRPSSPHTLHHSIQQHPCPWPGYQAPY